MRATDALREKIARQDAHIARMIAHDPTQASIKAAKRIAFVMRAEMAHLENGGSRSTFDLFAAADAARKAVR